jgi:hypothetical protein
MKNFLVITFLLFSTLVLEGQNYLNLYVGYGITAPKELNKSIEAFSYARPWLTNKQPLLESTLTLGLGFTGILAKGLFLSPDFQYNISKSNNKNAAFNSKIDLHWWRGNVNLDIYPFEFGLDSVGFMFRPFVRIGGGASAILPRIYFNDSLATVNDEEYTPHFWTYQFSGGIGCRIYLNRIVDIMPFMQYNFHPNVDVSEYNLALHGTSVPGLSNVSKVSNLQFLLSVSFKLGRAREFAPEIIETKPKKRRGSISKF